MVTMFAAVRAVVLRLVRRATMIVVVKAAQEIAMETTAKLNATALMATGTFYL